MSKKTWAAYKLKVLEHLKKRPDLIYGSILKQKPASKGWIQGLCPFHNDHEPSFGYHRETLRWVCFACGKGDAFDFIMHSSGMDFKQALLSLGKKLEIPPPEDTQKKSRPPIPDKLVQRWQTALSKNLEALAWLHDERGLDESVLAKHGIGWDKTRERYTIPIRDEQRKVRNVRLYGPKKKPKIINYTVKKWRYGSPARLYGLYELANSEDRTVLICEGEMDKLLADQHGFLAVTGTHGCTTFLPEWVNHFADHDVVIIYDCDDKGKDAVSNIVLKAFQSAITSKAVRSIRNVTLPLEGTEDDKDLTDYFHKHENTATDLRKLIEETPPHVYEQMELVPEDEEIADLKSFVEIEQKELIDRKVRCNITVCGETSEAFHAVEEFEVTCSRKTKGQCFECGGTVIVPHGAREYIGSCMATDTQVTAMLRAFCCRHGQRPAIKITRRTTVKEFFCHQRVSRITDMQDQGSMGHLTNGRNEELVEKRVYYMSSENVKPGNYQAVGWVKSHPRTQQVTYLIKGLIPQEDDFEAFNLKDNLSHLRALQKMTILEIVEDMCRNVTRVYKREEILLAVLLAYLSPRWIWFNGERLRGWLSIAVIGDTGTAKTQTYTRLADYIGIGDIFSGLTGSRTGLAYALVEHKQKGWQVRIGRFPANSRKLLMVDEVQEIPREELRNIAKAMDEGFLQVDRVRSKGYESETRLLMLGNPKRDTIMDDHPFGCITLKAIFPVMMIRRLDFAVFVNANDLPDLSFIREKQRSVEKPRVTREMLRALVYWAWNLKESDIEVTANALEACLAKAGELATLFGHATDVPLITSYECEKTLVRVAVASAVLDCSTDEDFIRLTVHPEHIEDAARFLTTIYSHENCMLDQYSRMRGQRETLSDYEIIARRFSEIIGREKHEPGGGRHSFRSLLYCLWTTGIDQDAKHSPIKRRNLADMLGRTPEYVTKHLRILKSYSLIESTKYGYIKQPKFMRLVRQLLREHKDFFDNLTVDEGTGQEQESPDIPSGESVGAENGYLLG